MKHLLNLLFGPSENEIKLAFKQGFEVGKEAGILEGMAKNFERSKELSEEEYQEVMKFLIDRNLELCCYDILRGGFRIRKKRDDHRI